MRRYIWPVFFAVAALVVIIGLALVGLYSDWLWFKDLGFGSIFSAILWTRVEIGLLFGILFFAIIYGNLWYARKIAPPPSPMSMEQQLIERLGRIARRGVGVLIFLASIVISAMVGLEAATHWEEWLRYFNATPFGARDAVFNKDIGFYVFQLPLLSYVYYWLFFALAAATIASVVLHYAGEAIEVFGNRLRFAPKVKTHLGVLVALMFFLKAWGYRLAMYSLLFAHGRRFDGAGYTEVHANLPALWIMVAVVIFGGVLVLLNIFRRGVGYAIAGFAVVIGASIVVGAMYPYMVETYSVVPNEREKQAPYITRAIGATQSAYGLDQVAARDFAADTSLTPQQIDANRATIENIRLWDQEHLQAAYNQIQTIQQYYHFQDLDVDRYWLADPKTGEKRYRQVWLSARELSQAQLPSQSWINQHLQFTHGYGFAMSPVNEVSSEGLPEFFVYNIPPKTTVDTPIDKMQTYFGELTSDYAIVKGKTPEFDYPTGRGNKTTRWDGSGGVQIGSMLRKLLFSLRFSDVNMLLNEDIQPGSRILYRREIHERTEQLFPFLTFDSDPYLVTVKGRLYWIRDGYTTTDAYPYSRQSGEGGINYIRNSVKVVVDAYSGSVTPYIIEKPLKDPIIRTYAKIFPGVFKPISEMPAELRQHIRYPENLFALQTSVYTQYHYSKSDPSRFYNNSDLWKIANKAELAGAQAGQDVPMEPYYIIMKLPNGKSEEFILMTPYIRAGAGRKNMVAWICAKCDGDDYGRLVLYRFPESTQVNGPEQVVGLASQDPTISQQLTLWNREGSSVGTGNVMVIPIESSLLYVMPVYIESTSTRIPEVKRVIVALGDKVSMQPTLAQALTDVVGAPVQAAPTMGAPTAGAAPGKPAPAMAPGVPGAKANPEVSRLINEANSEYQKAVDAQKSGDWATYGQQIKALEKTLKELQAKSK